MTYYSENCKYRKKKKILKAAREKCQVNCKGKPNRITAEFSTVFL
jgi:hypothetical protein